MASALEREIQHRLSQYLAGGSLADFENWFLPTLWEVDGEDEETRALAGMVHILISEFSRGDRTLQELRDALANAIRNTNENHYVFWVEAANNSNVQITYSGSPAQSVGSNSSYGYTHGLMPAEA